MAANKEFKSFSAWKDYYRTKYKNSITPENIAGEEARIASHIAEEKINNLLKKAGSQNLSSPHRSRKKKLVVDNK